MTPRSTEPRREYPGCHRADAGEFGAVVSRGHDDRTGAAADAGGRPDGDEFTVLGTLDPAATDENVAAEAAAHDRARRTPGARSPVSATSADQLCAVGRTTISFTSTSAGCSIA
jgi:hypothetical protein